jgi:hypothetical protein
MARGEVTSSIIFSWRPHLRLGARKKAALIIKKPQWLNCWLLCHLFSLCVAREGFFSRPVPSLLLTGARSQHVRNLAAGRASKLVCATWCPASLKNIIVCHLWEQTHDFFCVAVTKKAAGRASGRANERIGSCYLFWGGVLLGIMLAEHDARPLLKRSPCVIVLRANTKTIILSVLLRMNGVGIVDGYVPPKDKIPKNPYRVFLRYWLVKYRENTIRYRTELPNQDATLQ